MGLNNRVSNFLSAWSKRGNEASAGAMQEEGVVDELAVALSLDIDDKELLKLSKNWRSSWEKASTDLSDDMKIAQMYWRGQHYGGNDSMDNVFFEAVETFIPLVAGQNPDPVVSSDGTDEGEKIADIIHKHLVFEADQQVLKMKLNKAARQWSLKRIGVLKIGWDLVTDSITTTSLKPENLILDPDATIDGGRYYGSYLGEYKTATAEDLMARFPKKKEFIKKKAQDKLGTKMRYIEWWTDRYLFFEMENEVLAKVRNPHWNYDRKETEKKVDNFGNEEELTVIERGSNHFKEPQMPYAFISYYTLDNGPFDDTTAVLQAIPLQDSINKRRRQINKNADNINSGMIIDTDRITKAQGEQAAVSLRRGDVIGVPGGANTVARDQAPSLPPTVFNALTDDREELRNIVGVRGVSAQGTIGERTLGGKILSQQQDTSRSSGPTDALELTADYVFNWWVQMFFVYYTEEHVASVVGDNNAREYTKLRRDMITHEVMVSVKPGTLVPKDPLTKRNESVQLFEAGALDPVTLFERLDYPDPIATARRLWQWQNQPEQLLGVEQPMEQLSDPAQGQPAAPPGSFPLGAEQLGQLIQ